MPGDEKVITFLPWCRSANQPDSLTENVFDPLFKKSVDICSGFWYNDPDRSEGALFTKKQQPDKAQTEMSVPYPAFSMYGRYRTWILFMTKLNQSI